MPTIVFHGADDSTVHPRNGAAIVEQAVAGGKGLTARMHAHCSPDGRACTQTVHADATGRPVVEHWALQDTGHAWSGGSAAGSFTDPGGPDASREMIRFFFAQFGEPVA